MERRTNRMANTVRIAPDVLRYLREERRHLSISSAAKKLGIETEELAAFESCKREPTIAFVELMSRKYGINEAWFYLDSPIKVRKHKSHRTLFGRPPMEPAVLKLPEVADILKVHRCTLTRLIKRGGFPAFKIGTEYRINREHLAAWLRSQTKEQR